MKPIVSVSQSNPFAVVRLLQNLKRVSTLAAYVGIPASKSSRRGKKVSINNAELLFIHTHGSPIRGIPARPVLEPAIQADGNRQPIANELALATQAVFTFDLANVSATDAEEKARKHLMRAALEGQRAGRAWFTDPRNNWAPNSPSTIKAKGSSRPLIDTSQMRNAIIGIVK